MAYNSKPFPKLCRTALRLQSRLLRVHALHRSRTDLIEARSTTHSSHAAPIGFVRPWTSPPPRRFPRRPLHFHGRILKVPSIVAGECGVIKGIVDDGWLKTRSPCPGFAILRYDPRADCCMYVHYTDLAHTLLKPIA